MKFNEVTWYSKLLALVLFIALPFVGFYAGTWYQKGVSQEPAVKIINGDHSAPSDLDKTHQTAGFTMTTSYKNGQLEYTAKAQLPSPCHNLKDETRVAESFPEQIFISFVVEEPKEGTICAQVITEKTLRGKLQVSSEAKISVRFNNQEIN